MRWRSAPTGCCTSPSWAPTRSGASTPTGRTPPQIVVATGLGVPDSVKFDAAGLHRVDAGGQRARCCASTRAPAPDRARPADPGSGQLHVRGRSAVRLELHRRDHRDPRRRSTPGPILAGCPELAAGSRGRRRRTRVRRRRHLLLCPSNPTVPCRRSACSSRRAIRASSAGWWPRVPGEFVGDHVRRPGHPLPAGARTKAISAGRRFRPALRRGRRSRVGRWSSPNWAPGGLMAVESRSRCSTAVLAAGLHRSRSVSPCHARRRHPGCRVRRGPRRAG